MGLEPDEVAALSRITSLTALVLDSCPKFNDNSVKQILPLKNLEAITISNCKLTSKSLTTFCKFPKLQVLHITVAGWSEADKKACAHLPFKVVVRHPKLKTQDFDL